MKYSLFRRILLPYIIIAFFLLISLGLYLSNVIKDHYITNLKESLFLQALLIADQIPESVTGNFDDFCKKFKDITGARVTIIDRSGLVLGDSDEPSEKMENHSNRPEIKDAEISDTGSSIRFSKTLQKDLLYLAIAVHQNSDKKFVRLSLPLQQVEIAVNKISLQIIIVSITLLLLAILIGLIQTGRLTRAVKEITEFSKEVAKGNFKKRLFLKEKGELRELSNNISEMAQEIHTKIRQSDEEKNKIEAILKNMSDGLILTDIKGTILLSNAAVKSLFSIGETIEGKTIMETLRKTELMELIDTVIQGNERVAREIEIIHPKELYLMVTATPYYSHDHEGKTSKVILMFHDITRLKKLEEIRKDFVANVSHEIKTPITAIKGFTETLLEGAVEERENAHKFLEMIRKNSERLNSLVNDLLTLSRIELGDIRIDKTLINIDEVIDTVFTMLKDKAQGKGLYLKKQLPPEDKRVYADRDRLIQILLNLVDNGIKFTEEGGVTVKIQSRAVTDQQSVRRNLAEISVEDTGIGISKRHLARLGERFYRVDRARSRDLGGTGLGLAIVKHLVMAHGWEMEVESIEGKGTKVHLFCPFT